MTGRWNIQIVWTLKRVAQAAGATVMLLGALGFLGWALDIPALKSVSASWVTMKANTGLAFILAGASLGLLGDRQAGAWRRRFVSGGAGIVALIGGLTLIEYALGWDLGIDQLLFREAPGAIGTGAPGRMAPTTALNFLLLGAALLLLDRPGGVRVSQGFTLTAGAIGLLNLLGYAYSVPALYGSPITTEMAVHTAAAFLLLSLGLLCARPEQGVMAPLTSPAVGGVMARRLLLPASGGLLLLGWLKVLGEKAGLYDMETGTALLVLVGFMFVALLVGWTARLLNRMDAERKGAEAALDRAYVKLEGIVEKRTAELSVANEALQRELMHGRWAEAALRASEAQYRLLFENNPHPMWVFDLEMLGFLAVNEAAIRHYGYSREEFLGMTLKDLRPPEDVPTFLDELSQPKLGLNFYGIQRHRKKDGSLIDVEITAQEIAFGGRPARLILANDVTVRNRAEAALRESEQRFYTLATVSPVGIFHADAEGAVFYVNARWCEITGLSREAAQGTGWRDALHPDDRERVLADWERAVKEQVPFRSGYRFRRPDGRTTWVLGQAATERGPADAVFGYVGTITDITEQKHVEEKLQRLYLEADQRRREAETFGLLARELTASLELDPILKRLVGEAQTLSQSDFAFLALAEPDGETLTIRTQTGAVSSALQGLTLTRGAGMAGKVLEIGEPLVTADYLRDSRFSHEYDTVAAAEGTLAQAATPIMHDGRPLGVLVVARRTPRPFTPSDVEILNRLAYAASLACHHAMLYQQAATRTAALEHLWQVGQALSQRLSLPEALERVVEAGRDLLRTEHAVLTFWDEPLQILTTAARTGGENPRFLRKFRPGEGAHGTVAATRRSLVVNDYATFGARIPELSDILTATAVVPLLIEDRFIGTLGVYATKPGRTFTAEDLRLLELLAQPAANSVENARLHGAAVRRGEELAALLRATQTLMAGLDIRVILERIVQEASRITGVPYVTAFLLDKTARILRPGAASGVSLPAPFEIRLGESFSGTVAKTGEALFVADARNDRRKLLTEGERGFDFVSYLGFPIKIREEVLGVMAFYSAVPWDYDPEMLAYLASFADQAAIALENARLFEQVRAGRERLRAISRRLVEVQEAKSRELARELHDQIGQILTGLQLTLEMSARLPARESKTRIGEAQATVRELLTRIRELSLDLRPAMLDDLGLLPALLWQFERYTAQTRVRVTLKHSGLEGRRFPPDIETAAYRIVQEALTNVARHAGVNEVAVQLWADQGTLGVQVEDQGKGFEPEAVLASSTTSGLVGMRERASLLGGHLTVGSRPGAGTRVIGELPLGQPVERRKQERRG